MNQEAKGPGQDLDSELGFGGALAFGKQMGDFRAELELAYQEADIDEYGSVDLVNGDVKLTTFMANAYYEVPVYDAFSVYGMAGVGVAKYELYSAGVYDIDGSDNVFAYKAGAGVTYNFTDDMAADLGYEYLGVADTDLADSINGHNIVASFRYKF
jgi:opacity protein-like surface antigen